MLRNLSQFWRMPQVLNGVAPANVGVAKKRIRAVFYKCSPEEKKRFPSSCAQVTISVDQPIHYGAKFHTTMNLVKNNFRACKIMVDDTVQRHTYAILYPEKSNDELYQLAYAKGSAWIAESINTLSNLTIPCEVVRWDRWLTHPDFPSHLEMIKELFEKDETYRSAVESSIHAYLERFLKRYPNVNREHAYQCCVTYLQEECAGMILWPELKCEYEIYPSGRNGAMEATYDRFIKPEHPDSVKIVSLRFHRSNVTYETEIDPNEIVYEKTDQDQNQKSSQTLQIQCR